ncbi:MAG: NAC family transcription factor [Methanomicrobium sp.]|nr:NAC family transcription factor [Methanomicrobium sp.]MDD4299535.1 NAC family transcription factor [Methanomicrobium sp.]
MSDKDGDYCTVCGGMVPSGNDIKQISVDGKVIGINRLDFILSEVRKQNLSSDSQIKEEIMKRASVLNYIPSKKRDSYAKALMDEYKKSL